MISQVSATVLHDTTFRDIREKMSILPTYNKTPFTTQFAMQIFQPM